SVYAVPVSALEGDNVVRRSRCLSWFTGPALLEYLEGLPVNSASAESPLRFPVQYVIRPDAGFRGFAGQVASGMLRRGAEIVALPSGIKTRVKSIAGFEGEAELAPAGRSACITLEDEIDISRGDMLASAGELPSVANEIEATLVWMHATPLDTNKVYLLKHTTRSIRARIKRIRHRIDVNTLAHVPATELDLNEIASVEVHTTLPLYFDAYRQNRVTGSFILIDPMTNATVAGGVIDREAGPSPAESPSVNLSVNHARVTSSERALRYGHAPGAVWLPERPGVAEVVERALFDEGWHVLWTRTSEIPLLEIVTGARALRLAGLIAIFSPAAPAGKLAQEIRELYGAAAFFEASQPGETDEDLAARILKDLRRWRGASSHSRKEKP
ncbi:MAG: elongation factor 1-alpha C-terminal domain-related protein, partial [Candidatus Acidiferrales bacterium]